MRTAAIRALRLRGASDGLFDQLFTGDLLRLVDVYEEWDTTGAASDKVRIGGVVAIASDPGFEVGGVGLSFGLDPNGRLEVPFTVELPAAPTALLLAGLCVHAGFASVDDFADLDLAAAADWLGLDLDGTASFADLDLDQIGDLGVLLGGDDPVRVTVGPVPALLVLPKDWLRRGTKTTDDAGNTIVEADDDAPPVAIPLGTVTLSVGLDGVDIGIEPVDQITLPPVVVAGTGVAIEAAGITWLDDDSGGGLAFGQVTVWGLGTLLPFLPDGDADEHATLALTDWVLRSDGLTGEATVTFGVDADADELVRTRSVSLAFERSWWPVALDVVADVDLGGLVGDSERLVEMTAGLRVDPTAAPDDRWAVDIALNSDDDTSLATFEAAELAALGTACASLALLVSARTGEVADAGLLLGALAALDRAEPKLLDWDALAIEGLSADVRRRDVPLTSGRTGSALVLTVRADVRIDVSLLPPGLDPIPVGLGAAGIVAELVLDDIDDLDRPRLAASWTVDDGVRVTLPAPVDVGGPVTVTDASLRLTNGTLVLELGVDAGGDSDVAIGGLPDVITVTYDSGTDDVSIDLGRRGQPITLLVPGVLYAEGSLRREDGGDPLGEGGGWGETLRGELRAFLVTNGQIDDPAALLKKDSYLFDLEVGLLSATRESDGLQAFVLTLDAGFRPGLPIGTSGVALYGLGLTYAQNGAPAANDGDYGAWFLDPDPKYSTTAKKWVPQAGHWGFGASAALGSAPDNGTTWNVAAGLFLLLPGPVIMVTGKGNVFSALPQLPAQGGDPDTVEAAFAAIIVLDLLRDRFSLDLRGELTKTAAGQELLHVNIPAEIRADLTNLPDFRVSLGMPTPDEDRIQARALDLWDLSAYLVVSGQPFDLPLRGRDDLTLPGIAFAFGGAGGLDRRFEAGPVALALWARAGFDVGLSLRVPLLAGQVWVEGGIDVSAFGFGVSMQAELVLLAIAPQPFYLSGTVRVVLELPWFLPDIDMKAELEIGGKATWLDDAPEAASPVESLTLWGRGTDAPFVLSPGDHTGGVPLDVIPELVFAQPVGNDETDIGSLVIVGTDKASPVWDVASTADDDNGDEERLGYRHVLTGCTLRIEGGDPLSDVPATWPEHTETGNSDEDGVVRVAGNQVARTKLRLFDPLAGPVEARVGLGASMTRERWDAWDPCDIPDEDAKSLTRTYTFRSLSHLLRRGVWQPPIIDVDLRPIDGIFDSDEEEDDPPIVRPGRWQLPDLDIDPVPELPDIRPFPRPGRPGGRPRPGPIPRPGSGRRPKPHARPQPGDSDTPPTPVFPPLGRRGQKLRQRESIRELVAKRFQEADATTGESSVPTDGRDVPTFEALTPLILGNFDFASTVMVRPEMWSTTLLDNPIRATGSLPLLWASRTGAVTLDPDNRHDLPNETPPDDLHARLIIEETPSSAGFWRRSFGVTAEPARLGRNPMAVARPGIRLAPGDPVLGLPRLVVSEGQVLAALDSGAAFTTMVAEAIGRARIDLPYSERAEATLLLAPGVHALVWAVDADGTERLLETPREEGVAIDGGEAGTEVWRLLRYRTDGPTTALRFAAYHGDLDPEPSEGRLPVAAALLDVTSFPPVRDRRGEAMQARDQYADLVSDLFDQRDAWADGKAAGVLKPATTYTLTVNGVTYPARETDRNPGHLELGDAEEWGPHTFSFTTAANPPSMLRAFPGEAVPADTDSSEAARLADPGSIDELWQVATSPADGSASHYRGDPLVVRLRDARTLAVFVAFERELRVRLTDDRGNDVVETVEATLRAASDVPAHEAAVRDRLGELSCLLPEGANPDLLWSEAVCELETVLEPSRRYTAELLAVAEGDEVAGEPLHRWRFRASRWMSLDEHVDAHSPVSDSAAPTVPLDEIVPDGTEIMRALRAKLGAATPGRIVVDDEALDAWLVDTLSVPPRRPPDEPELVVVRAWEPRDGTATPVALLMDGPEPLLRDPGADVRLHASSEVDAVIVTGRSRARVLIIPVSGQLPTGSCKVTVHARSRSRTRLLAIADRPAVLGDQGDV